MIAGASYKQGGSVQQEEEEEEGGGNCQSQAYWKAECVFGMLGEGGAVATGENLCFTAIHITQPLQSPSIIFSLIKKCWRMLPC